MLCSQVSLFVSSVFTVASLEARARSKILIVSSTPVSPSVSPPFSQN